MFVTFISKILQKSWHRNSEFLFIVCMPCVMEIRVHFESTDYHGEESFEAPKCSAHMFCAWQAITQSKAGAHTRQLIDRERITAQVHLRFVAKLYCDRYFLHEHPLGATSWNLERVTMSMWGRDEVYRQGVCRGIAEHEAGRLHDQLTQTNATPAAVLAESAADPQEGGTAPQTEDMQLGLRCTPPRPTQRRCGAETWILQRTKT